MKVLILGGTRFVGRLVAERLVASGASVTVLSRRGAGCPQGATLVSEERGPGLARIAGQKFDMTLDFICYDGSGPREVFDALSPGTYVLISSTWVPRLKDEATPLLDITRHYLMGKSAAEDTVADILESQPRRAVSLRLPIMLGKDDHTARLDFYRARLCAGHPVIAVDGAHNLAQVAWSDDIADAITTWVGREGFVARPLYEVTPDNGAPVRDIIQDLAAANGVKARFVDVSRTHLEREFVEYLVAEPLWRESSGPVLENNLFSAIGKTPTPRLDWFRTLSDQPIAKPDGALLEKENYFISGLVHA